MPIVKCLLCNKNFERTKEPCIQIGNRYVHKKCTLVYPKKTKELLELYLLVQLILSKLLINYFLIAIYFGKNF